MKGIKKERWWRMDGKGYEDDDEGAKEGEAGEDGGGGELG